MTKSVPSICAHDAMAIYDGQVRAGTVVKHDGTFVAFDAIGTPIGKYATLREAMIAIPNFEDCAHE
jgi:hypothetical protein